MFGTMNHRGTKRWTVVFAIGGVPLLFALGLVPACSQSRPSALTPGAVKKHIERGVTTQAEVIEVFGTPNVITMKEGYEMWVYDKVSSRLTTRAFGIGGLGGGVGGAGAGAGGGAVSGRAGSVERSETTVMLIVYFGENDVVSDYKITQTKF